VDYESDHMNFGTIGRRSQSRLRVFLPARLETLSGTKSVFLADLSTIGAKLSLPEDWCPSGTAVLSWTDHEALGRVVWVKGKWCGVYFEEPLPIQVLVGTRAINDNLRGHLEFEARRLARDWVTGNN
jgi:hypothetical protein